MYYLINMKFQQHCLGRYCTSQNVIFLFTWTLIQQAGNRVQQLIPTSANPTEPAETVLCWICKIFIYIHFITLFIFLVRFYCFAHILEIVLNCYCNDLLSLQMTESAYYVSKSYPDMSYLNYYQATHNMVAVKCFFQIYPGKTGSRT